MRQGQVEIAFRTRGGKRKGAGRKPSGPRSRVSHLARPRHNAAHPLHVTIRMVDGLGTLRRRDIYMQIREATIVSAKRDDFRIVHMSIQANHLHMLVEADHNEALSKGMQGFSISAAKRINKAIGERTGRRRKGKVLADRYHARPLTSPSAVRHALAYVLNNWRRHGEDRAREVRHMKVDPFSSGIAFPGWQELSDSPFLYRPPATYFPLLVFRPQTWLLSTGWHKFHPLIRAREVPGPESRRPGSASARRAARKPAAERKPDHGREPAARRTSTSAR